MKKILFFIVFVAMCAFTRCNSNKVTKSEGTDSIVEVTDTVEFVYDTCHQWELFGITDDEQEYVLMDTVSNMWVEKGEIEGLHYFYAFYKGDSYPRIAYNFRYEDVVKPNKYNLCGELDDFTDGVFTGNDSVSLVFDKKSHDITINGEVIKSNFTITFPNDMQLIFKLIK